VVYNVCGWVHYVVCGVHLCVYVSNKVLSFVSVHFSLAKLFCLRYRLKYTLSNYGLKLVLFFLYFGPVYSVYYFI